MKKTGSEVYRYGFNGKENDNEVKGVGNQQDYGMRIYDPRIGRFLSTGPLIKQYPMLTPYQFASNRPIDGVDRDGLEYVTRTHIVDANFNVLSTKDILYYQMDNKQLLAHGGTPKSFTNAAGYGREGRGVKHEYYFANGEVAREAVWEQKQGSMKDAMGKHGLYSGPGSITKSGLDPDDYDYSFKPIDRADAIAKTHDIQYFAAAPPENYQGFIEDTRTLEADHKMIKSLRAFLRANSPGLLRPTNRCGQSVETISAAATQLIFIDALAKYKEWKISKMESLGP